ncbi:MAG: [Fe-Fe] hydrogenase large subunit C-terminal domain-containing protein [Bacteroidales bacterium]
MENQGNTKKLVYTIQDKCRVCYTCVRECPVKAIKIINGQAMVITERCIACGNCTKVCRQDAKAFLRGIDRVKEIINTPGKKTVALVAPSFPAEFEEIEDYHRIIGMIRKIGFDYVLEVAFGADLVAMEYKNLLEDNKENAFISSDCPAIVSYIEHYHPDLVDSLAPIVSPMVAMARVARKKYGNDIQVVFIGPCIAKKDESTEINEALTFRELRNIFSEYNIDPESVTPSEFNPPLAGKGAIFPLSRGMLQTAGLRDNLVEGNIIVADGRVNFQDAVKEFKEGFIEPQHLELLCCEGCIMGPGMSKGGKHYTRRSLVSKYARQKSESIDTFQWKKNIEEFRSINMKRSFSSREIKTFSPPGEEIENVLHSMGKYSSKDLLDCGACGYDTCLNHAIAIVNGLAENEMCLPFTIEKLHNSVKELAISNEKMASMQQALKQSEKLAHMGQLSAGIAHELNNPLGVIIMYSNILLEECETNSQMKEDLELIVDQSARCKKIVGGLLNFARKNQVNHSESNIRDFIKNCISSIIVPDNISLIMEDNLTDPLAYFDPEQMIQVISNLLKNAVEAMPSGGELKIMLEDSRNLVKFVISDSGTGIKQEDLDKVFEPFFTTKEIGKGTGLGLATAYGIVKMHKGQISVSSNTDPGKGDTGTKFTIELPRNKEDVVLKN